MFEIHPIVWLQSWASPTLTAVMNGISLLGYTRAYVAIAVFLAFAFRLRAAVPLLVLVALSGAVTDIAKTAASMPRPDVDSRVQALALFASELRQRDADTPTEVEDSYGFPSGHVSATTAVVVGLGLLLRWSRRSWILGTLWIAAMGISRMYLGRHFPGDVLGGVVIGLATVGLGFGLLKVAHRVMAVAIVLAGSALLVGLPDAGDAGRMLGTASGALFLVSHDVFARLATVKARIMLLVTAIVAFTVAWVMMSLALRDSSPSSASALRLAASALPNAALLIVPACVPAWLLRGPLIRDASTSTAARR
ncbi:MAG TPA: phosphatase PAP2 family protein [Vicinamibacterales bacterium]|jgi:membrane-associated phospholipid phosphatase|nr:phosphatase PAP2 family protein [Vicinamibacterales bacterium]